MTRTLTKTLRRWYRLTWLQRALLGEATTLIALASLAIAFTPFSFVSRIAAWRTNVPDSTEHTETLHEIRWAILASAARVPWKAVCFQKGLAAHWMLRRRGIPSVLYYGAAPDDAKGLAAHVWVRAGEFDVVGCEEAPRFAVLLSVPATELAHRTER